MILRIKGVSFVWNDLIKQKIIDELNEQFDIINPIAPTENHSYADSIFSPATASMFKPISTDVLNTPNYFETTINKTRTIKEIPVHTIAFSDSFDTNTVSNISLAYAPSPINEENVYDMDQIINSANAITFSLTPEQRGVAIAKKASWKDVLFHDASLIGNTDFGVAVKKFCSMQIKI